MGFYFAILQLKDTLNEELISVYYTLAFSHVSLNIFVWGRSTHAKKVFILQRKIIRLLFNLEFWQSCKNIFISKIILPVPCIYIYKYLFYARNNVVITVSFLSTNIMRAAVNKLNSKSAGTYPCRTPVYVENCSVSSPLWRALS